MSTQDPNLPNYQNHTYRSMVGRWRLAQQIYSGPDCDRPKDFARYLPPEPKEPATAYQHRLQASIYLWKDKFKRTVNDFAAMLASVRSVDLPITLSNRLENIDNFGTSFDAFVEALSVSAGKFGGCFVLVDYQGGSTADSALEEIDRCPYLVAYDPIDIPNFQISYVDGKPCLDQITIAQNIVSPDGIYGDTTVTCYRVLKPGLSELWQIVKADDGSESAVLLEQRVVADRSGRPLTEIPIAYHSTTPDAKYCGEPDLFTLAMLNIHLWQIESDRHNVMHKCNLPTPVVADDDNNFDTSGNPTPRELVLGPNSFISLTKEGKAYFLEPSGAALTATKECVDDVKAAMSQIGLDFLSGQSAYTATQSALQATGTGANIRGMARQLNSTLSEVKRLWCLFTLEPNTGSIVVDDRLIQQPIPTPTN